MPRPIGEMVHGARPGQVLFFDYLYLGADGPLKGHVLDKRDGFRYALVIMDYSNILTGLELAAAYTARTTKKQLL